LAEKTENTSGFSASPLKELAPGKVNLCLFLGPVRPEDGRHELVTVYESVSLADELTLSEKSTGTADEVVCPGIDGPNLVSDALAALRASGWDAPPVRIEILKRIPVAAGMGGGSADAAAALRLARQIAPVSPRAQDSIAARLGADVPAQLTPGQSLGTGAGEIVQPLAPLPEHAFAIVPLPHALGTPAVYAEADRLGLGRPLQELAALRSSWREHAGVNDLMPAAVSLCPPIAGALTAIRETGAEAAFVCGSGPTCAGLWWGQTAAEHADAAVRTLVPSFPDATVAVPVAGIGHNSGQDR
jgi:4-diphosphocytidyl-2-C-methyl-D-erythritol kinase